ncbi:MAG: acyl carrier protein [Phycisphaerales bacterium]|jgi:acyl carrier protein|nr:acyl carrier protein [Phycisphaerales bacterium]
MAMSRDEIYKKVQGVLVDALGVDDEDVTPDATLRGDLGAESIDFLDIVFRLEKAFGIKIPRGEMFPEDIFSNAAYVQNGRVTPEGLVELKKRMPHMDFTDFEKDPDINKMQFTVNTIVNYIEGKLNG